MSIIYSEKQLEKIHEYASHLLQPSDIATLIEVEEADLIRSIQDKQSKASKAYRKGKAKTILSIQKQEVQLALMGSPVAVQNIGKYLTKMETGEDG